MGEESGAAKSFVAFHLPVIGKRKRGNGTNEPAIECQPHWPRQQEDTHRYTNCTLRPLIDLLSRSLASPRTRVPCNPRDIRPSVGLLPSEAVRCCSMAFEARTNESLIATYAGLLAKLPSVLLRQIRARQNLAEGGGPK